MLCDQCHKKIATVHLTEIINGKVQELHLCEDCALKKSQEMQKNFSMGDILSGLIEGVQPYSSGEVITCPKCGLTFQQFRRIGRLGCSECYHAFKKQLRHVVKAVHGSIQHMGKIPRGKVSLKTNIEIEELKKKLRRAVELEEFEEAAALRDKIKEMEKGKNGSA